MKMLPLHIFVSLILISNSLGISSWEKDISKEFLISLKNDISKESSIAPEIRESAIRILDDSIKNIEDFEKFDKELSKLKQEIETAPEEIQANESYLSSLQEPNFSEIKNLTLDQLLQKLVNLESEKTQKESELEKILINSSNRDEELKKLIQRSSELRRSISEIRTSIDSSPESVHEPQIIIEAKKILQITQIMSFQKELELVNFKIETYETNSKLINSRLELARADLKRIEDTIKILREEIDNKRREEIEQTIQKSLEVLTSLPNFKISLIPEISLLAEENLKLAKEHQEFSILSDKSSQYKDAFSTYQQKLRTQKLQFEELKSKVEQKEKIPTLRLNFKQLKLSLPKTKDLREIKDKIELDLAEAERKYSELLLRKIELSEVEKKIYTAYQQLPTSISTTEKRKIKKHIDDIIKVQKDTFSSLISEYDSYISLLTNTLSIVSNWIEHTNEFISFIEENMLWTKIPFPTKEEIISELSRSSLQFRRFPPSIKITSDNFWYSLTIIILAVLISLLVSLLYKYSEKTLLNLSPLLRVPLSFRLSYFARFVIWFLIRVLIIPLWLVVIALALKSIFYFSNTVQFVASALLTCAIPTFLFSLLLMLFKQKEFSTYFFNYYNEEFSTVYKRLFLIGIVVIITTFISAISNQIWIETQSNLADLVFRLTKFLYFPIVLILIVSLLFILKRTTLNSKDSKNILISYFFIRNLTIAVSISLVVLLILLILGYTYAMYELEIRIIYSLLTVITLLISYRFIERLLNFYRWKTTYNQSVQIKAKIATKKDDNNEIRTEQDEPTTADLQTPSIILDHLNKVIYWSMIVGSALVVLYIWSDIFPALNYLRKVQLWEASSSIINVQAQTNLSADSSSPPPQIYSREFVSLWDFLVSIFIFLATLLLFKNMGFYLDYLILQKIEMGEGEKYALKTILEYLVLFVGIVISLSILKVTWSKIQWLVAALGVGFGFGLQDIVANFVSGVILLFERPIRVGDIVTIGEISGRVKALRMRSTSIVNWENKELIVPNKEILSQKFVNWTRENPIVRLSIPIGVSYKSDINKVIEILDEIAKGHPFVEPNPTPKTYFMRFGSSALEFELRLYTKTSYYLDLQHELLCSIFNRFNQEGIEIAYPQLDVHIKSQENTINTSKLNLASEKTQQ